MILRPDRIYSADCYFYFAKDGFIPMWEPYEWMGRTGIWNRPQPNVDSASFPVVKAGDFVFWELDGTVPTDFKRADGKWTHTLYLIGFIRYLGALNDVRGYYFCKRYLPGEQRFADAKEYENED